MEEDGRSAFLRQIGIQGEIKKLRVKLTRNDARAVDFLGEDAAGVVRHVEFQVRNDRSIHSRMLAQLAMIADKVMKQRGRTSKKGGVDLIPTIWPRPAGWLVPRASAGSRAISSLSFDASDIKLVVRRPDEHRSSDSDARRGG